MLLFYRVTARDPAPSVLAEQGLHASGGEAIRLWTTLEAVPSGTGPVLVVDERTLPDTDRLDDAQSVHVSTVPPDAFQNVNPYRPPRPVTAGGGYVGSALPDGVAVLVIFRRGVWDLPKGTKAPDEAVRACAKREVREETGVETLEVLRSLGTTRHGYSRGSQYVVKTTHWYLMQTPERSFDPDHREGIRRVACARWAVARRHMGYDTLSHHMDCVEAEVRAALTS